MKKIKIFLNPVEGREKYINDMATNGYRLVKSGSIFQIFEKDENIHRYSVQYIGYMNSVEQNEYIDFLKNLNLNTFSSPINIGNLSFGRLRLRPYNSVNSMIATNPGVINKEILIIESNGDKYIPALSDKESRIEDINKRRVPYFYILVISILFTISGYLKIVNNAAVIMGLVLFIFAFFGLYELNKLEDK